MSTNLTSWGTTPSGKGSKGMHLASAAASSRPHGSTLCLNQLSTNPHMGPGVSFITVAVLPNDPAGLQCFWTCMPMNSATGPSSNSLLHSTSLRLVREFRANEAAYVRFLGADGFTADGRSFCLHVASDWINSMHQWWRVHAAATRLERRRAPLPVLRTCCFYFSIAIGP